MRGQSPVSYTHLLEGMGWKFYRVWSTDWFRNRGIEQERLLEAATEAVSYTHLDVYKRQSSDVLIEKIDGSASFEVYDPKIVEEDYETEDSAGQEQPSAALTELCIRDSCYVLIVCYYRVPLSASFLNSSAVEHLRKL